MQVHHTAITIGSSKQFQLRLRLVLTLMFQCFRITVSGSFPTSRQSTHHMFICGLAMREWIFWHGTQGYGGSSHNKRSSHTFHISRLSRLDRLNRVYATNATVLTRTRTYLQSHHIMHIFNIYPPQYWGSISCHQNTDLGKMSQSLFV